MEWSSWSRCNTCCDLWWRPGRTHRAIQLVLKRWDHPNTVMAQRTEQRLVQKVTPLGHGATSRNPNWPASYIPVFDTDHSKTEHIINMFTQENLVRAQRPMVMARSGPLGHLFSGRVFCSSSICSLKRLCFRARRVLEAVPCALGSLKAEPPLFWCFEFLNESMRQSSVKKNNHPLFRTAATEESQANIWYTKRWSCQSQWALCKKHPIPHLC